MKIVLAGKFEAAMVRAVDEVLRPEFNASKHPYYVGLNRKVPKSCTDRAGTFIAIADKTFVPMADWGFEQLDGESGTFDLGLAFSEVGGSEWGKDTEAFINLLLNKNVFSPASWAHISVLSLSHYSLEDRRLLSEKLSELSRDVAHNYLDRFLRQIKVAQETGAYLVIAEEDIQVLEEIGTFILSSQIPTPFHIPDVSGKLIEPDTFFDGVLNFTPPDIHAIATVRSDPAVRSYASKIASLFSKFPSDEINQQMLDAMIEAHTKSEVGATVDKIFEVTSWVVKPLHYVPVLGEIIGVAEDVKDLIAAWVEREKSQHEWYLLGVKMQDVAIQDYIQRKGNLRRGVIE